MGAIAFDNSYARLPQQFYTRQAPVPVDDPAPIRVNRTLALEMGLDPDWLASDEGTRILAGNALPEGAEPLASVYAGHQFGNYNPQLGDGRAVLLGEVVGPDGKRYDWQLKGSGPTPYSRGGDGRSPLGPVLREYIISEAMYRLGVPTTRSLAAVATGELVQREQFLPGAVLARIASSHIRIGTFQFFAARRDLDSMRTLAEHVIARHFPEAAGADNPGQNFTVVAIAAEQVDDHHARADIEELEDLSWSAELIPSSIGSAPSRVVHRRGDRLRCQLGACGCGSGSGSGEQAQGDQPGACCGGEHHRRSMTA